MLLSGTYETVKPARPSDDHTRLGPLAVYNRLLAELRDRLSSGELARSIAKGAAFSEGEAVGEIVWACFRCLIRIFIRRVKRRADVQAASARTGSLGSIAVAPANER
jgi:hypothetical protein